MVTIPVFSKDIMVNKKWKKSEISTLVAVFRHNAPNNTHKTNDKFKIPCLDYKTQQEKQ